MDDPIIIEKRYVPQYTNPSDPVIAARVAVDSSTLISTDIVPVVYHSDSVPISIPVDFLSFNMNYNTYNFNFVNDNEGVVSI